MKKMILAILFFTLMGSLLIQGLYIQTPAAGNGEEILQARCTVCHDTRRIERAGHDRAGWQSTVDRMMGKRNFGPKLSESEYEALIEHLVSL